MSAPLRYHPEFTAESVDAGVLAVRRFEITESMSADSRCVVDLVCSLGSIEPRVLLGKQAALLIGDEEGHVVRAFHGIIVRASEHASTTVERQTLRFEVATHLELLRLAADHRIFQDVSTADIVKQVVSNNGLPADLLDFRLEGASTKRVTATQFGETPRDFIDRLLQEDGIAWFVKHDEEGATVVFVDAASSFEDSEIELPYVETDGLEGQESIDRIWTRTSARPNRVTLRDHDFSKPTLDLTVEGSVEAAFAREHYEYPGWYQDKATGKSRLATVQAAQACSADVVFASGRALSARLGQRVRFVDTPHGTFDAAFVPIAIVHRWARGDDVLPVVIESKLTLLPDGTRFVPPSCVRPWAVGSTATVTVPPGEEIHCDEHGRVKVQFEWDRYGKWDDKSSGFVRVSQMHTSGSIVVPRKDWEVLVEFEDGDPDRPLVVGRLYNAGSPPTDSLPGGKSNSTLMSYSTPGGGGHNGIRMNDGGGGELMKMHAEKDLNLVVANDKQEKVATSATTGIKVNQDISVGASQTEKVGAGEQLTVGGSQTFKVGAARTKTVSGDNNHSVTGSRSVTIGGNHTTMTPMSDSTSTSANLTETVGGMCLEVAALGVGMAVAGSTSISVGAAKIEAVATGKDDTTVGARATTIGGAFVNVSPGDIGVGTKGVKATLVGGAWLGNAGGEAAVSSDASISVTVGGAVLLTGATVVLKVGGSSITLSGGTVSLDAPEVKISASGPVAEAAGLIGSK